VAVGAANSPITASERFKVLVTTTPQKLAFSRDMKQIEIFNMSKSVEIYVDITGLGADIGSSMPVMPLGYYALGAHISASAGVSFVCPSGECDVRVVAHY
jgi:hypothetical protein